MKLLLILALLGGITYGLLHQSSGAVQSGPEVRSSLTRITVQIKAKKEARAARESARIADEKAKAILASATSKSDVDLAQVVSSRVVPVFTRDGVADLVRKPTESTFGASEWNAMYELLMRESGLNPWAFNKSSGACGIFQALPCSKMGGMEIENQIKFGIGYIKARYGSPSNALAFHNRHNWY